MARPANGESRPQTALKCRLILVLDRSLRGKKRLTRRRGKGVLSQRGRDATGCAGSGAVAWCPEAFKRNGPAPKGTAFVRRGGRGKGGKGPRFWPVGRNLPLKPPEENNTKRGQKGKTAR
jgi:hypothetical protein